MLPSLGLQLGMFQLTVKLSSPHNHLQVQILSPSLTLHYSISPTISCIFLTFSTLRMEQNELKRQVALMRDSLFDQGFLDEQFDHLEKLQDDEDPNFAEDLLNLFFNESSQWITDIENALVESNINFIKIVECASKLLGNSSSIGAKKVMQMSLGLQNVCNAENAVGCKKALEQLKTECAILEAKLQSYFHLAKQTGRFNGASTSK